MNTAIRPADAWIIEIRRRDHLPGQSLFFWTIGTADGSERLLDGQCRDARTINDLPGWVEGDGAGGESPPGTPAVFDGRDDETQASVIPIRDPRPAIRAAESAAREEAEAVAAKAAAKGQPRETRPAIGLKMLYTDRPELFHRNGETVDVLGYGEIVVSIRTWDGQVYDVTHFDLRRPRRKLRIYWHDGEWAFTRQPYPKAGSASQFSRGRIDAPSEPTEAALAEACRRFCFHLSRDNASEWERDRLRAVYIVDLDDVPVVNPGS